MKSLALKFTKRKFKIKGAIYRIERRCVDILHPHYHYGCWDVDFDPICKEFYQMCRSACILYEMLEHITKMQKRVEELEERLSEWSIHFDWSGDDK